MPRRTTIARPAGRPRSARPVPPARGAIATIVVAVPARDEVATVRRCLRSIDRAAVAVPGVQVVVVVAADRCRDGTADRARATLTTATSVLVVEGSFRGPGAARAAAVAHGLDHVDADPATVWIASTDADCSVADDWLAQQLAHALSGVDAVAGIVRLDAAAPARLLAEFAAAYAVGADSHDHVHAACLGVRAGAYLAVDGWSPHAVVGEDHNLWGRLARAGFALVQPVDVVVTTSARTHGRVVGGFATTLGRLAERSGTSVRSA